MTQSLYAPGEASAMMKTMCERVDLSLRAGSYILSMCRLRSRFPGGLVDMVEVAQIIKYVSENQDDLKPQFKKNGSQETGTIREPNKTRTWYKPANPM
jgi:hypothetical protein